MLNVILYITVRSCQLLEQCDISLSTRFNKSLFFFECMWITKGTFVPHYFTSVTTRGQQCIPCLSTSARRGHCHSAHTTLGSGHYLRYGAVERGGGKISVYSFMGLGKIWMHRHLTAISKRLKTIAKIFTASSMALSIFPNELSFPFSLHILHDMLAD